MLLIANPQLLQSQDPLRVESPKMRGQERRFQIGTISQETGGAYLSTLWKEGTKETTEMEGTGGA